MLSSFIKFSLTKLKFYGSRRLDWWTGVQRPDNPPINTAKPYDEVSKSTNCPLIVKHNDRKDHKFVPHHISFASVCNYFVLVPKILYLIIKTQLQKCY